MAVRIHEIAEQIVRQAANYCDWVDLMSNYYFKNGERVFGPMSTAGLQEAAEKGWIGVNTLLKVGEEGEWKRAPESDLISLSILEKNSGPSNPFTAKRLLLAAALAFAFLFSVEVVLDLVRRLAHREPSVSEGFPVNDIRPQFESLETGSSTLRSKGEKSATSINSVGISFVTIPAGTFTMGSSATESGHTDDETQHKVSLKMPLEIGIHEVTQAQFLAVMKDNPSQFKGPNLPVHGVSWKKAREFCRRLSTFPAEKASGYVYRLPTEAEWEYACRAGTKSTFSFDKNGRLRDHAWYCNNSGIRISDFSKLYEEARLEYVAGGPRPSFEAMLRANHCQPHVVGLKKPNAWGIYDMHGNVCEWCFDRYGALPQAQMTDPNGPATGSDRVVRGGGYYDSPEGCRSAYRFGEGVDFTAEDYEDIGFRVVRSKRETE